MAIERAGHIRKVQVSASPRTMQSARAERRSRCRSILAYQSLAIASAVIPLFCAPAHAGNTWTGGGANNNWSDNNNWGGAQPGYGTLTFSGSTRTTNSDDNITAMNQLFWSGTSSWTLNQGGSTVLSLFDNGGTQAKIENQSTGLVTINLPITFANTNATNPFGEINAVNGDMSFGTGTLTVNGSQVNGIKMFGSARTVTFNNTISAGTKWFGFTTGGSGNTAVINGTVTSGDWYVMNTGTLNISSTGNMNSAGVIRLGGDFGNTGNQDQTKSGTLQLTSTTGGQTLTNIINSVTGNTSGALALNSLNTSNTNTISGNIFLDSALKIQQSSGGTLAITNSTLDLKAQTLTLLGSGGSINITGVIGNSTGSGQLVIGTNGTASTGGTVTLSSASTYSGDTFVRNGTLAFTSAGSAANSTIRLGSSSGSSVDASINFTTTTGGTTISSTINPVTTSGSGALTLNSQNTSGTNTYSGHIGMDRNFTLSQSTGGTLSVTQARSTASGTTAGTDIKNFVLTISGGGNVTFGTTTTSFGTIYDSVSGGSVVMSGTGTLTMNDGNNSYRGGTTVNSGTLLIGASDTSGTAGPLGGSSGSGRSVKLGNTSGSANASLLTNGAFTLGNIITVQSGNTGVITIGGNTASASTFSGAINLGTASGSAKSATFVALSGGSVDVSGVIDENTSVPASGVVIGDATHSGTVKFSNTASSYGGTTTVGNGATLEVVALGTSGNSSIGNSTRSTASNLVINGATLKYTGAGESTGRLFTVDVGGATVDASAAANGALSFTGASLAASGTGDRALTLTGSSTGANTMTSIIVNPSSGSTSVVKNGAGTWLLGGANTYSGNTTVSAGTLKVGSSSNVIPDGSGKGNLLVNNGGTFDLNNFDETINGLSNAASNTTGVVTNSVSGTKTLSVGANNTTSAFDGVIQNGTGTVSLTKTGSGTFTLSNTSTYTGATAVSAGTLSVSGSIADSAVTLNGTGTLKGTGTVGDLVVDSGGTVAPGNSVGNLKVGTSGDHDDAEFKSAGSYEWEMTSATGSAGSGYDVLTVTGTLTISATSGSQFTIKMKSGVVGDFDRDVSQTWTVVDASALSGYATNKFILDDSDFIDDNPVVNHGYFRLDGSGGDVLIHYSVPEPGSGALLALGAAGLLRRRRRNSASC